MDVKTGHPARKKKIKSLRNNINLLMIILYIHFMLFAEIICFAPPISRAVINPQDKDQCSQQDKN
jgi:hypothetical protein